MKIKNRKLITKFLLTFIISVIITEVIEFLVKKIFNIDIYQLKFGVIGIVIIYGFKYHIFCCLLPAIFAGYKCKHKKCDHDHCG